MSEPSEDLLWTELNFSDGTWKEGMSGLGYGEVGLGTVLPDMRGSYSTLYIRRKFTVPDPKRYRHLLLTVKVDDGLVVYLNGKEIDRVRAGPREKRLPQDVLADAHAPEPIAAVRFLIDLTRLQAGENVIAIQGLNSNLGASSDFALIPSLQGALPLNPAWESKLAVGIDDETHLVVEELEEAPPAAGVLVRSGHRAAPSGDGPSGGASPNRVHSPTSTSARSRSRSSSMFTSQCEGIT